VPLPWSSSGLAAVAATPAVTTASSSQVRSCSRTPRIAAITAATMPSVDTIPVTTPTLPRWNATYSISRPATLARPANASSPSAASDGPRQIHPDALHLGIQLQVVPAHLPAEPRLLVAAERRRGVVDVVAVDPDRAGLQRGCGPVRFLDVAGPHSGTQTVGR